jgi:hypothetical protein
LRFDPGEFTVAVKRAAARRALVRAPNPAAATVVNTHIETAARRPRIIVIPPFDDYRGED